MPPRRTRAAAAAAEAETTPEDTRDSGVQQAVETNGPTNEADETQPSAARPNENGAKVNGKTQVSAAQRKREKRKQRKRQGSVVSDSDTESVNLCIDHTYL